MTPRYENWAVRMNVGFIAKEVLYVVFVKTDNNTLVI